MIVREIHNMMNPIKVDLREECHSNKLCVVRKPLQYMLRKDGHIIIPSILQNRVSFVHCLKMKSLYC